jgi:hypothetical protein
MAVSSLQLVDNISVINDFSYSQAVNMNGANAIQVTLVVTADGGTTVSLVPQGSNDLSNWTNITVGGAWAGLGAGAKFPAAATGIAYQYVRISFKTAAAGPLVCSAYLCTSFL